MAAADVKKGEHSSRIALRPSTETVTRLLRYEKTEKLTRPFTVPPKVKGRKRDRDADKPLSGLDVHELLRGEKRLRISPENAIPEFKQTLANTADIKVIQDAVKQMCSLIEDLIKDSLGDINYDRAVEGLGTMKEELIAFEEPNLYNQFIRRLKQKLLNDELNGDRREMWWLIRRHKLGLIAKIDSEQSVISLQEAREVSLSIPSNRYYRGTGSDHVHSFCPQRTQRNEPHRRVLSSQSFYSWESLSTITGVEDGSASVKVTGKKYIMGIDAV
jgi:hypothetical protein